MISTLHKQAEASVGHSNDQLQIVAERLYEQAEARIGQSIARLQNFADRLYELAVYKVAESRIEQTRGLLQNFANRSEITLQEMAFSFENKTAATGDKVEILQQAVDELTQSRSNVELSQLLLHVPSQADSWWSTAPLCTDPDKYFVLFFLLF